MANSIVLELQRLAANGQSSVVDVLRLALIVATKLKIQDFKFWIENELNGYDGQEIPAYRSITGRPHLYDHIYHRWIKIHFETEEMAALFQKCSIRVAISEVQAFSVNTGALAGDYPAECQILLNKHLKTPAPMKCSCMYHSVDMVGIVNKVKDLVLKWSLKLEEQGILGHEMQFDESEKAASANPELHIDKFIIMVVGNYVAGNINGGNVAGGNISTL